MYEESFSGFPGKLRLLLALMDGLFLLCPFLLLPALHDFGAHLQQTVLRFAFWEAGNCFCGAVDVKLGECACLLDAVAFDDKFAGLDCNVSVMFQKFVV